MAELDTNKTYLEWNDATFPNSARAEFKAPAGSEIDWGDGTIETFATASTEVNTHTYTDGITKHTIVISGLTSIGSDAFRSCSSLTSVTIPDSVTSIGSGAFWNCSSLASVTIGNSVTSIGYWAFSDCNSLTSMTIPDSVTSIGQRAFSGCRGLTSITMPDSVTSIGEYAFFGTAYYNDENNWENGVLYIGEYLIDTKQTLSGTYTIKYGTMIIGDYAFENCSSLTSVTIPDSVTSIGLKVFHNCSRLTSVTIGNGVTSIGYGAFYNCSRLTGVTIPDSVTSIGSDAFRSCTSLTSVYITDIAAWCKISFGNVSANPLYYAKNLYLNNKLVTELAIPDSVTSIGQRAFYNCSSLTSVTIPDSVTSIGSDAFRSCTDLKTIILFPETPPTLGSTGAIPTTISSIYVPKASEEAYKTETNWAAFASKILSDNIYLSFVRFNQKNKEYIDGKINELKEYLDSKLAN